MQAQVQIDAGCSRISDWMAVGLGWVELDSVVVEVRLGFGSEI